MFEVVARQGLAGPGKAGPGGAWQGTARHGLFNYEHETRKIKIEALPKGRGLGGAYGTPARQGYLCPSGIVAGQPFASARNEDLRIDQTKKIDGEQVVNYRSAAGRGSARHGQARPGQAWQGLAWPGEARQGLARPGKARRGQARRGEAWQGRARLGGARRGKARHGLFYMTNQILIVVMSPYTVRLAH